MKKVGMRTIKTGIAVTISVILTELGIVSTSLLTVSACIMSMKSTVRSSLKSGLVRLLATLLGGILGYIFSVAFDSNYWFTGLGVILTIHLCYIFNFSSGIVVSSLAFVSILLGVTGNDPLAYSIARTFDTAIGVIVSIVVNYSVSRKKYLNLLYSEFLAAETNFLELAREISRDRKFYMQDELQDELEKLNHYYDLILDELHYLKSEANIQTLKISTDKCSQIYYHLYGMYIVTHEDALNLSTEMRETIRMYHKDSVINLLYEIKTESNIRVIE